MAIRATTNYKALYAGIVHAKLAARARLVKTYSTVKNSFIALQASTVQLTASALTVAPFAQANWQNIFLSGIKVNANKTIFTFTDAFSFSQDIVFSAGKNITTPVSFSDDHTFSLDDVRSDSFDCTDYESLYVGAVRSSLLNLSDSTILEHLPNYISTLYLFDDSLIFSATKQSEDEFDVIESHAFSTVKVAEDDFDFTDSENFVVGKAEEDSYSFVDEQSFVAGKISNDEFDFGDSFAFVRDPYAFTFVDDGLTTTVTGYPDDEFDFNDTPLFDVSTVLFDAFGFDDTVNADSVDVNKQNITNIQDSLTFAATKGVEDSYSFASIPTIDISTVKFDSYTLADSGFEILTGKVFSHSFEFDQSVNFSVSPRVFNALDLQDETTLNTNKIVTNQLDMSDQDLIKELSKVATDSIIGIDSPLFEVETTPSDLLDLSDAAVMSTVTVFSDSQTLTDHTVIDLVSSSSQVNHSMLNEFILNG